MWSATVLLHAFRLAGRLPSAENCFEEQTRETTPVRCRVGKLGELNTGRLCSWELNNKVD